MAALRKSASKSAAKTTAARDEEQSTTKAAPPAARKTTARKSTRSDAPVLADSRAFQRSTRQSPYKMRLVIDQIRGKNVNDALGLLKFSKKHAAKQI